MYYIAHVTTFAEVGKGGANMKASKLSKLSGSGSPTRVVSHDLALSNFIEILNLSLKIT